PRPRRLTRPRLSERRDHSGSGGLAHARDGSVGNDPVSRCFVRPGRDGRSRDGPVTSHEVVPHPSPPPQITYCDAIPTTRQTMSTTPLHPLGRPQHAQSHSRSHFPAKATKRAHSHRRSPLPPASGPPPPPPAAHPPASPPRAPRKLRFRRAGVGCCAGCPQCPSLFRYGQAVQRRLRTRRSAEKSLRTLTPPDRGGKCPQ